MCGVPSFCLVPASGLSQGPGVFNHYRECARGAATESCLSGRVPWPCDGMADMPDSKSGAERREGSTPSGAI